MLGSETATATSATPGAAGTTGKAATASALDDATRAKLMEIRTHITAYAAAMSGTATPKTERRRRSQIRLWRRRQPSRLRPLPPQRRHRP